MRSVSQGQSIHCGNHRLSQTLPPHPAGAEERASTLTAVGLFAGIGGIEYGLHLAGHQAIQLCEIDPGARAVLRTHFPGIPIRKDIRRLRTLPKADIVTAGFPCQDLSQAGKTTGIRGSQSGLVGEVLRLLDRPRACPRWLLLENVPFMLRLQRGEAMRFLTDSLNKLGFTWAYRTVDTRAFGLPQRRLRVLLLASRLDDPKQVLFPDDAGPPDGTHQADAACGFYWSEGNTGLGWAVDAVPTMKGGSNLGIPSPPAIWMRPTRGGIVTPDIRDAERLQGFPPTWTSPAGVGGERKQGSRWKLVGNAVSVPVSRWIGLCLGKPGLYDARKDERLRVGEPWPSAAWGEGEKICRADVSMWPRRADYQHLHGFLQYPPRPLSARATAGFLARAHASRLRFEADFLTAVAAHLEHMKRGQQSGCPL
jgi:DNA (cytosine-5)-methyltransferase 1